MSLRRKIVVVGSLNIDYFTEVHQFPQPGETILASEMSIRFGGKGANQAVAAARLGAQVDLIGCAGDDDMGHRYVERLGEMGIGTSGVDLDPSTATGSAFINVDASGENTIVVAPGANGSVSESQVEKNAALIEQADCVLLQNEVPPGANDAAARIAASHGVELFYNPSPWREGVWNDLLENGLVILNETEAAALFGEPVLDAGRLCDYGNIVVTRGSRKSWAFRNGLLYENQPPRAEVEDTVGAGDTFVGALAARGLDDFGEAFDFANRAASLATTKVGAQEAMPTLEGLGL